MDHQGQFRRAALELGISDEEINRFSQHLRLSIGLSGGSGGVPVGQFGGVPRLPVGMDWPSAGNSPLPFIFSVDCGALPGVDGFDLPVDGTLLFFLDHEADLLDDTGRYARVVYVQDGTDTAVAETPRSMFTGKQYGVSAALVAYDLWPGEGLAGACIGGYTDDEVITSIAEQTLAGLQKAGEIVVPMAKWSSHVEKESLRLTSEWISLARFPVADEYYYGSFAIRHDDLAAARVHKALPVTKFSE
jgi:hypothetical protein